MGLYQWPIRVLCSFLRKTELQINYICKQTKWMADNAYIMRYMYLRVLTDAADKTSIL